MKYRIVKISGRNCRNPYFAEKFSAYPFIWEIHECQEFIETYYDGWKFWNAKTRTVTDWVYLDMALSYETAYRKVMDMTAADSLVSAQIVWEN